MLEQRLPMLAKWSLYALGATEGKRTQATDAVAAWLLRHHPSLLPSVPQPEVFSTIRVRTELVDRMVTDLIDRARNARQKMVLWSIGGGFDSRWHRLVPEHTDVVSEVIEVESPSILELKAKLLTPSPYIGSWMRVGRVEAEEADWTVRARHKGIPLVVLEAGAGRLEEGALGLLLQRIRYDAPDAKVIVGLPADTGVRDRRWSQHRLAGLGWRVEEDIRVAARSRLVAPGGREMSPGMYPFRLALLSPRESLQS